MNTAYSGSLLVHTRHLPTCVHEHQGTWRCTLVMRCSNARFIVGSSKTTILETNMCIKRITCGHGHGNIYHCHLSNLGSGIFPQRNQGVEVRHVMRSSCWYEAFKFETTTAQHRTRVSVLTIQDRMAHVRDGPLRDKVR